LLHCYRFAFRASQFATLSLLHGWQFKLVGDEMDAQKDVHGSPPEDSMMPLIQDALEQSVRKPFELPNEMLETKLGFLWILCFAPVMPVGVITHLVAWCFEAKFDLVKMLYVKRRPIALMEKVMHRKQVGFLCIALVVGFLFSMGLSLVTYNDTPTDFEVLRWVLFCVPVLIMICVLVETVSQRRVRQSYSAVGKMFS